MMARKAGLFAASAVLAAALLWLLPASATAQQGSQFSSFTVSTTPLHFPAAFLADTSLANVFCTTEPAGGDLRFKYNGAVPAAGSGGGHLLLAGGQFTVARGNIYTWIGIRNASADVVLDCTASR